MTVPPVSAGPPTDPPEVVRHEQPADEPRRHRLLLVAVAVAALLGGAGAVAVLASPGGRVIDAIQSDGEVRRLEIDLEAGDVTVTAADQLAVTVERRSGRFGLRSTSTADTSDGVLRIDSSCRPIALGTCGVTVTVTLPPGTALAARTRAGSLDVEGATAGVDLRTDAGPIRVRGVEGGVLLRSEAGPLEGSVAHGDIEATTSAGSISLTVTEEVSQLTATTEAGPVELVVPDAVYAVQAGTTVGRTRIQVDTAADAPQSIHARSEVGSVTVRTAEASDGGSSS